MRTKRIWLLLTLLVAIGAAFLGACGGSGGASSPASPVTVEFVSPQDFSVADHAGKPLVVNYFGSWCGPCNAEAPDLATFSKENSGQADFIGVAVNDQQGDVVDFMSKYGLTYPVVIDDNSLSAEDGITGVPTTIFYDASGKEVDRIVGAASLDQLTASLAKTR
jgi:cytochrome c biogenesis protein CcmG, thiol:disulfide interchange protein DsbE